MVLDRDRGGCVIFSRCERLHVHHIDRRAENDLLKNLVTHCEYCHARVHSESAQIKEELDRYFKKSVTQGFISP